MDNVTVLQQGKALAMTIKGLMALDITDVKIGTIEAHLRPQLIKTYQRQLRTVVKDAPPEILAEIVAVGIELQTPMGDPGVNSCSAIRGWTESVNAKHYGWQ